MASIIKTDNIQKVSDDSNIIKKCGSTITLGSCGASVALASGATQQVSVRHLHQYYGVQQQRLLLLQQQIK